MYEQEKPCMQFPFMFIYCFQLSVFHQFDSKFKVLSVNEIQKSTHYIEFNSTLR